MYIHLNLKTISNKMTIYTTHLKEEPYTTQYPSDEMLGIGKGTSIYVSQGGGKISDSAPLESCGFGRCCGAIIKNTKTNESAVFHIDSWSFRYDVPPMNQSSIAAELVDKFVSALDIPKKEKAELSELVAAAGRYWNKDSFADRHYDGNEREKLKKRMTELNKDNALKACFVMGDVSRDLSFGENIELLNYFGITDITQIKFKTGEYHWDLVYHPTESLLLINPRIQKKVLTFNF